MSVNGRCFYFLEQVLGRGLPGRNVAVHISETELVLSIEINFAIALYEECVAYRRGTTIRTLCHKFPGHVDDPIINGFRHRHDSELLHIKLCLADEVFNSRLFNEFKNTSDSDMQALISALHVLFTEFQPVLDRTNLAGKCRKRTGYDLPRLVEAARYFGEEWGFSAAAIIIKYNAMAQVARRKKTIRPLPTFSPSFSSHLPLPLPSPPSHPPQGVDAKADEDAVVVEGVDWFFNTDDFQLITPDPIAVLTAQDAIEVQNNAPAAYSDHCFDDFRHAASGLLLQGDYDFDDLETQIPFLNFDLDNIECTTDIR